MKIDCESGRHWSASRLVNEVKSLARGLLMKSGMKKGDVVAFYCPNSDHHSIALLAVSCIGAIYTGSGDYFPFRKCWSMLFHHHLHSCSISTQQIIPSSSVPCYTSGHVRLDDDDWSSQTATDVRNNIKLSGICYIRWKMCVIVCHEVDANSQLQ